MTRSIAALAEEAVRDTQLMMIMEYTNFESKLYERFAELVARECMDICTTNYHTGDGFGLTTADIRCSDAIARHFNVEKSPWG